MTDAARSAPDAPPSASRDDGQFAEGDADPRGSIHPTAVIDAKAELGRGVHVGPYCVIHAGVVLGDGCRLQNHVTICGPSVIGPQNEFFAFASIGQRTQDLKYAGEPTHLEIGCGNTFREFATVHRGTAPGSMTRIGSRGCFLAYSHVAHDCTVGDHVTFSNNGTLAGHVVVEDFAVIGGLSAVHQFCRIGQHSISGGCSKIVQDIPPFMIADGNPAAIRGVNVVGLQRRKFSEDSIRVLKNAYRTLYRKNLNLTQAVTELERCSESSPHVARLVDFIKSSQRGIIR